LKYDNWIVAGYDERRYDEMLRSGVSPLLAAVLCSHGVDTPEKTRDFLSDEMKLNDPLMLTDMDKAAARVKQAIADGEYIVVYGDYDVDGITATCLLTDFLQKQGAKCGHYIPGRIEEGYGLNTLAIDSLYQDGVSLIITVDCGITAVEETAYASNLGIDLVITDHHECKDDLPDAVAVVNPHRSGSKYPFESLAGVGVAFKLDCAIAGPERLSELVDEYCDLVCLGTVADVMPLLDENRFLVKRGITSLQNSKRPGVRMLIKEANVDSKTLSVSSVGFTLAPRINAAGRMGQIELATGLFFSETDEEAANYAAALCALNRQRQEVEASIYKTAVTQLAKNPPGAAIVLADESWHQGVVGIVASRLAEEYRCPTFLICLDGEKGKASSRSFGGFNLFSALEQCDRLLSNYGGHELAAGFTIEKGCIDAFREKVCGIAEEFFRGGSGQHSLNLDFELRDPSLLTLSNISELDKLEPCGCGSPKPLLYMKDLHVDNLMEVGGGRHLKLRLIKGTKVLNAIFFSVNAEKAGIAEGDMVDVAFCPQINEYRGTRSVQLLLTDIRCDEKTREAFGRQAELYGRFEAGELSPRDAELLLPVRDDFVALWRYMKSRCERNSLSDDWSNLARKVSRYCGRDIPAARLRVCLDVFDEHKLIKLAINRHNIKIRITSNGEKIDLGNSVLLAKLKQLTVNN